MIQTVMTFVAEIDPARLADLRGLLAIVAADPGGNDLLPMGRAASLHFSSMVIFERVGFGPIFVWENNFDGPLDEYIDTILEIGVPGLNRLYSCCTGFPKEPSALRQFLRSRVVLPNAYHIGATGRSVNRISKEAQLRVALESTLDREGPWPSACAAAAALRKSAQSPALSWALVPELRQGRWENLRAWISLSAFILLLVLFIIPVIVLFVMIAVHELFDRESHDPLPQANRHRLLDQEDRFALNHMAALNEVKPGIVRHLALWLVLRSANLVKQTSTKGTLGGIPSIHFAHWSLIGDGRWLIFLSNYGGSWGGYLDDFIEKQSSGLTGIWSNVVGFPRATLLFGGGAKNGPLFKTYARNSMAETLVWYAAYPDLTIQNVNRNSDIRDALAGGIRDEAREQEWLRLL